MHGPRGSDWGGLHVNTSSSTWAFELGRLAETILAQLRAELGEAAPRVLAFAPGALPESRAGQVPPGRESGREPTADERGGGRDRSRDRGRGAAPVGRASVAASLSRGAETPSDDRRF